jgi:hypothetical protein
LNALDARCLAQHGCLFGGTAIALSHGEYRESVDVDFDVLVSDSDGIRTFVIVDDELIKVEIVREARIELSPPVDGDRICGVARLTAIDLATSKLLALAHRWADDSVHSRYLIDLAMMNLPAEPCSMPRRRPAAPTAASNGTSCWPSRPCTDGPAGWRPVPPP